MKLKEFIDIYRDSGQNLKYICGSYFQTHGLRCFSYPFNYKIIVTGDHINALKWKYLITHIFTDSARKNAIEFILDTNDYDINRFGRKTRNRINKSLQNCSFRRPGLEELLKFGLNINRQTLKRQHRRDKKLSSERIWSKYITTLYSRHDFIFWGAFYQNSMIGYIVVFELEGVYNLLHAYIDRQGSTNVSPMCGMLYTLINQIIEKEGSIFLSYGLDQLTQLSELNRFKRNMLFNQIPVTKIYVLHPLLLILFKLIICFYINILKRRNIKNRFVRKVISVYQGNRIYFRDRKIHILSKINQ